jgi:hypothetical protein
MELKLCEVRVLTILILTHNPLVVYLKESTLCEYGMIWNDMVIKEYVNEHKDD